MNDHNINTIEATEHLKTILNVGKNDAESDKVKTVSNGSMEASGDSCLLLHERTLQNINLCLNKESSHIGINGSHVNIYSSPLEYGEPSSQVIVEEMVKHGWEEKYYNGHLIRIHLSGLYLAYVLKLSNNKPGYVRLFRLQLELRHLIKDYKSEVKDIAFAHTTSQVLLGSVDACGELLVHKISDDGAAIICNLLLRVIRPSMWTPSEYNRILWCLYIPDDNETVEDDCASEDISTLLVVTHNERAEIWNIDTVTKEHGHGNLKVDEVKVGVQIFTDYKTNISTATFSPDGTAIAIGSMDGMVKFFNVNTLDKELSPKCLHHWSPHPQKSVSSLYFLDNYQNHKPDEQLWKYAVTGADNNTEIKLWSCETWSCLQTIRIYPNPEDSVFPCLKAEMDLSSKYLFLSDIKRKVVLIFHTEQDVLSNTVKISSLSEYRVKLPVLSLTIANIYHKTEGKNSEEEGDQDQMGDILNDLDETPSKYTIKLFWIQSKALQSCRILFKPKVTSPLQSVGSVSSLSQESFVFKDGLSDISVDSREASNRSIKDMDLTITNNLCPTDDDLSLAAQQTSTSLSALPPHISTYPKCAEVLLTPDDFTSPSHSNLSAQSSFTLHEDLNNSVPKCDSVSHLPDGIDSLPIEPGTLQRRKSSQHSGTSSPSREVAEILAPTKTLHLDETANEVSSGSDKPDEETVSNNIGSFTTSGDTRNQAEYQLKDWPQAPDPSKDYRIPTISDVVSQNISEYAHKLDCIINELTEQRGDVQKVQNELKILRKDQKLTQTNTKDNLLNRMEQLVTQSLFSHHSKLENLVGKIGEEHRQRSAQELVLMSDEISATFGKTLDNTLKLELSNNVIPQINRVLDTIAQKLLLDFNQKVTATDNSLRENLTKHLKGKAFTDALAQTLTSSFHNIVQSACKDLFQHSVVPSFDRACQQLFQQLNEHFSKGLSEYVQVVERHAKQSSSQIDQLISNLKEEINGISFGLQQLAQAEKIKQENHNHSLLNQQEMLVSSIRSAVQEEVRKCLREQTTAILNSRATTPVPHSDPQWQKQQLLQLVKQGNFDEAFQQALSAMDVQLVLFLCEKVNVDQIFGVTPCPLQQHVLLSLLNQLSADLNNKTEIRVQYIEDVIASLDTNHTVIKEHLPGVVEVLQHRITIFLSTNPNHRLSRSLKRISLAAAALIKGK